ncbi:MAG: type II toxin-antitoxin system VapC family toxin [Candidatus Nanohaloarchaea archaeon]
MKLLDTSAVVEIDRGNSPEKIKRLDTLGTHAISQVTVTELFMGVEYRYDSGNDEYSDAKDEIEKLISRFKVLPIDRNVCLKAAKIVPDLKDKGRKVDDLHDTYIAATGVANDLELLTGNPDHFQPVEDLDVMKWREF